MAVKTRKRSAAPTRESSEEPPFNKLNPLKSKDPPNSFVVFCGHSVLGSILSFTLGRVPGVLPTKVVEEMALPVGAICLFSVAHLCFDQMALGRRKHASGCLNRLADDQEYNEDVMLAMNAARNQQEQLPCFVIGTLSFSYFVNGFVGGVLGLLWVILRLNYSRCYRKSHGLTFANAGLHKFTIPCYFIINAMSMGSIVHFLRYFWSNPDLIKFYFK